jgi:hypothetical protein
MPRQPVGLLILRVWVERESSRPFRATISTTPDVGSEPPLSMSAAEPDEVIDAVRRFIEQVVERS